MKNKFYRRWE